MHAVAGEDLVDFENARAEPAARSRSLPDRTRLKAPPIAKIRGITTIGLKSGDATSRISGPRLKKTMPPNTNTDRNKYPAPVEP
jgi:hypothetical protein